jgi:thiol-disulfide isomerase/thioredoxin
MRVVAAFALLATISLFGQTAMRRAPGFALPDPEYKRFYDLQDYRGKVLVIDIMSTTCPHCMLTSTTLEQVKKKYGDKVGILSVVLPPDDQSKIAAYVARNKVTVPIVCDMGQTTIAYLNAKPGQMSLDVPHLFIVDKAGMIRGDYSYNDGSREIFEGPKLYQEIDQLLK